jgi:2'-5' RNA ligase
MRLFVALSISTEVRESLASLIRELRSADSSPNLSLMANEVNRSLEPLGIPREGKPFVPHLSIARFKETRLSQELRAEIAERKNQSFGSVTANEFHLMESMRKSAGAEYTTLRSFRFVPQRFQE